MGVIAQQDSDNDLLLNIIETRLAKRDFDGTNKCDGDAAEDPFVPAATGNAGYATVRMTRMTARRITPTRMTIPFPPPTSPRLASLC